MSFPVCDCHVHVFDPARYPYVSPRRFTPGMADISRLREHMAAIGAARVILVQPSVYGDQHDCLLGALDQLDDCARAVVVIGLDTTADELARLNREDIVGARLNLAVDHIDDAEKALGRLRELEARAPGHWHIQLHVDPVTLQALEPLMASSSRRYVLDHFALTRPESEDADTSTMPLTRALERGNTYVKLSAPYLVSTLDAPHIDLHPLIERLSKERASRLLWGSNWPHTQGTARSDLAAPFDIEPFRSIDDASWLDTCNNLLAAGRIDIHENAARLYRFT